MRKHEEYSNILNEKKINNLNRYKDYVRSRPTSRLVNLKTTRNHLRCSKFHAIIGFTLRTSRTNSGGGCTPNVLNVLECWSTRIINIQIGLSSLNVYCCCYGPFFNSWSVHFKLERWRKNILVFYGFSMHITCWKCCTVDEFGLSERIKRWHTICCTTEAETMMMSLFCAHFSLRITTPIFLMTRRVHSTEVYLRYMNQITRLNCSRNSLCNINIEDGHFHFGVTFSLFYTSSVSTMFWTKLHNFCCVSDTLMGSCLKGNHWKWCESWMIWAKLKLKADNTWQHANEDKIDVNVETCYIPCHPIPSKPLPLSMLNPMLRFGFRVKRKTWRD